jgi:hypothetical protein
LVTEYAIGNGRDRQLYTEWRTDLEYDPENWAKTMVWSQMQGKI